jgi:hypothetical protein
LIDGTQKNHRRTSAIKLLGLLRGRKAYDFDGIGTGDESWLHYHCELYKIFAPWREKVTPSVLLSWGFKKL